MWEGTGPLSLADSRNLRTGRGTRRFQAGHEEGTQSRDCIRFGRTVTGWDTGERSHNGTDGTPTGPVSGLRGSRRPLLIAVEASGWLEGGIAS